MRHVNGWVKVQRKVFLADAQANDFVGDAVLLAMWLYLIAWANRIDGKGRLGRERVEVKRGDVLTSQAELARVLGVGRQVVRRCLAYLETTERIIVKSTKVPTNGSTKGGTLVTILNYDAYQSNDKEDNQAGNQASNNAPTKLQPSSNQVPTTYWRREEEKKGRKEEVIELSSGEPSPPAAIAEPAEPDTPPRPTKKKPTGFERDLAACSIGDQILAVRWIEMSKKEAKWRDWEPDADKFTIGVMKLRRAVNLNDEQMGKVLDFIDGDDFWRQNCLSPDGMLKKSERNGLRKIDNVLLRLKGHLEKHDIGAIAARVDQQVRDGTFVDFREEMLKKWST